MSKRTLIIQRKAPYGQSHGQEALELALVCQTLEQTTHLAFIDDGVFQLLKHQQAKAIHAKPYTAAYQALASWYDLTEVYVEAESLAMRGLTVDDLMIPVHLINSHRFAEWMSQHDIIINF